MGKPGGRMSWRERVKITEEVRKYAAERGLTDAEAIQSGMQEKTKEFLENGAEVYAKT
jgi:phosphomethylpyrimidine synthase